MKYVLLFFWLCVMPKSQADITIPEDKLTALAQAIAMATGIDQSSIKDDLQEASFQEDLITSVSRPKQPMNWLKYRQATITPDVINNGQRFCQTWQSELRLMEKRFGVPASIVAAIIGVETRYGRNLGQRRLLDTLTTLALADPRRQPFFFHELKEWFLLNREESIPLVTQGSFLGAFGISQFLPSVFRDYAIDFDGDGKKDIFSMPDAIGSVGHFFFLKGWQENMMISIPVKVAGMPKEEDFPVEPTLSLEELQNRGIQFAADDTNLPKRATLIILSSPTGEVEYRLGFRNFYILTRYNKSYPYARSVELLAESLQKSCTF